MSWQQLIKQFETNPKSLFLIDGFGAIVSAFLLGIVWVKFEKTIGIPASTLYFLAMLPLLFAIYDCYCYGKEIKKTTALLKAIAVANILYCFLSLGCAFYHFKTITYFGYIYIIIEILIILVLARIELKVAQKLKRTAIE